MSEDKTLSITPIEALALFTAEGDFVSRLRTFTDTSVFYTLHPDIQEATLVGYERHRDIYKRLAEYLEDCGVPAMMIYNYDTKVDKPKGGI